jgi:REP-associated tyrosine transposase
MARQHRLQLAGGTYHLMTHGVRMLPVFRNDDDRDLFLELLGQVVVRHGWRCHGYCLMTTHYHLLVETPEPDLALGMQHLNGWYAAGFNRRYGTCGHVFDRRYHSVVVESEAHFVTVLGYIAANPVRADMCKRPGQYPYSSYAVLTGSAPPVPFLSRSLLGRFHSDETRALELLRAFVESYTAGGARP